MSGVLTSHAIVQQKAASQGAILPIQTYAGAQSAAAAASGYISANIGWNSIGTSLGSAYYGIPMPTSIAGNLRLLRYDLSSNTANYLAILYKLGTVTLTATGNQFTHNANFTGPINRTNGRMGTATAINMTPICFIDTATSTTAPVFTMTSYTNQAGSTITGAKTMTMPLAATVAGSGYFWRLEDGDSAVQDVGQVNVGTASSTGKAIIIGAEWLAVGGSDSSPSLGSSDDLLFSPPSLPDLLPGTPTSGSLTYNTDYWICPVFLGAASTVNGGQLTVVQDN